MLFQPTNITPNVLGGAESGTVDVTEGLTIRWQVNGNSPMVAYKIVLYRNNTASTVLYTSTTLYPDAPVYPIDYKGEMNFYEHTIEASVLSSAGITNGNEYKIGLTQYWDSAHIDTAHSVTTSSAPVFRTRASAHVEINSPDPENTIESYAQTFTGQYYQGDSYSSTALYDPLEWAQWKIYDSAEPTEPIYDSQKIYTQELKLEYDGFLNGRSYIVELEVMNTVGQSSKTQETYSFSWATLSRVGAAQAKKLNNQSSAVKVSWTAIEYTSGEATGDYTINDSSLILPHGSTVVWNTTNDSPMVLPPEWALIMHTVLYPTPKAPDIDILTVTMSTNEELKISFDRTTKLLSVQGYDGTTSTAYLYADRARLKIVITKDSIYVYKYSAGYGLVPQTTLTPNAGVPTEAHSGLEPSFTAYESMRLIYSSTEPSAEQGAITDIEIGGAQTVDFIEVVSDVTAEQETEIINWAGNVSNAALPTIKTFPNASFVADFDNGLDAGNYSIGGIPITGWDIYRKKKSDTFAKHLCSLELGQMAFYDYGIGSQTGTYSYAVYPRSDTGTYITAAIVGNDITPTFWNWSIIEAVYDEANGFYKVLNEFVFRNNVESGSISNNNKPNIADNFTRYPTVQLSNVNYQSGTLKGLIGQVGYTSYIVQEGDTLQELSERFGTPTNKILSDNGLFEWETESLKGKALKLYDPNGLVEYHDDLKQRDTIWALSTTSNNLFLKNRKGDVIEIRIAGDVSMETMDNTPKQALTASVPWVQTGDTESKTLIGGIA